MGNQIKPVRIQRKRTKGFELQAASPNGLPVKYVGRPTEYGNPFVLGGWYKKGDPDPNYTGFARMIWCRSYDPDPRFTELTTGEQVLEWFEWGLRVSPAVTNRRLKELAGFNLACWCPLTQKCHADIWLEYLNGEKTL